MKIDFATATRIIFGPGSLKEAAPEARRLGRRALLVEPAGRVDTSALEGFLHEQGVEVITFRVADEPTIDLVKQGIELARSQRCDLVIGMGGGSVIDTGKAISAMLTNPGDLLDYLEVVGRNLSIQNQAAPLIAIPTTAGTGSEVTRNAVLSVPERQFKVSMRSPLMLPRLALVDPELTYRLPPAVTASTGMDALAQVLEPFVSKRANPMTDMFCREGISRAARSLRRVYRQGDDPEGREDMAWVSLLGGLSLANAGLGAVHGFASPIGGQFNAPHGAICACLLAPVVRMNVKALNERAPEHPALQRYEEIASALTGKKWAEIQDGIDWLEETCTLLNIPRLSYFGLRSQDVTAVAEKAARASSMQANPIVLTQAELEQILAEAL